MRAFLSRALKWLFLPLFLLAFISSLWFWFTPVGLTNYVNKITLQLMLQSPETLTSLGIIDNTFLDFHSGSLDDYTEEAEEANRRFIQVAREGLDNYGPEGLEGQDLLSWKITAWLLDDMLEDAEFPHSGYRINQLSGITVDLPSFITDAHQITNRKSVDRYLSRINEFGRVLHEIKIRVESDSEAGVIPPTFIIERSIEVMQNFIAEGVEENPLVNTLGEKLESIGIDQDSYEVLMGQAKNLVEARVIPGYQELIVFMESITPESDNRAGIDQIPQGDAIYRHNLRSITTTDFSPSEIHEVGLLEVERIEGEMNAILDELNITGRNFTERLRAVMTDPAFIFPNNPTGKTEMLNELESIYLSIMEQVPNFFITIPPQPLEIRPVPEYAQATAPGGYYNSPALDGSRPGIFYINQNNTADNPRWTLPTLLVHEGAPGHHFQISSAQLITGVPLLRQLSSFSAYVEGWALYAEYLVMNDMGLYDDDPLGNLGRLQAEMFRAVRLVVDTGLHAFSWTRESAIDYMVDKTGMTADEVTREIERYVVWPGQATAYKTGQLALLNLRRRAEDALGNQFDLREFHELILMNGAMPLALLSQQVDSWIASKL